MITETVLDLLVGAVSLIVGLIPEWTPPDWVTGSTLTDGAATMGEYAGGLSFWVPWSTIAAVVLTVTGVYVIVATTRLALWAWSKVPVIGS